MENVKSTFRNVVQFIIDNVDNELLTSYSSEKLNTITHGETASNHSTITVELCKKMENGENTYASFTYCLRPVSEFKDEEGNLWLKFENHLQVNYPSYNSSTTKQTRERMQIITEAVELAEKVERNFTYEIQEITLTKAQFESLQALKKENEIASKISQIVRSDDAILKGIRVNGERIIRSANLETIPPGEYVINISGVTSHLVKSFKVTCTGNAFGTIVRTT